MKDFEIANDGINQQSYNSIQIIFTSFAYPAQKTQNSQVMATRRWQWVIDLIKEQKIQLLKVFLS